MLKKNVLTSHNGITYTISCLNLAVRRRYETKELDQVFPDVVDGVPFRKRDWNGAWLGAHLKWNKLRMDRNWEYDSSSFTKHARMFRNMTEMKHHQSLSLNGVNSAGQLKWSEIRSAIVLRILFDSWSPISTWRCQNKSPGRKQEMHVFRPRLCFLVNFVKTMCW